MIVRVLTTCHTQYTWHSSICVFLFNRTTLTVFVTYLTGALYVHPLWLYRVIRNDFRVLTTCHTRYIWERSICFFLFYLIEQDSKFLLHILQVLYMWTLGIPELKVRIRTAIETITADMLQTVWNELDYHVDVCRITNGAHIEHLYGM